MISEVSAPSTAPAVPPTHLGGEATASRDAADGSRAPLTILFLHPGPGPLHSDPKLNMLHHLGQRLTGGAIFGSWTRDRTECEAWQRETRAATGGFDYRPVPSYHGRWEWTRPLRTILMLYRESVRTARELPTAVDVVVGYSPYGVGLAAWLVAWRLGVPLIIQIQNDMRRPYLGHHGLQTAVKRRVSRFLARFVLNRARGWHVYFPGQTGSIEPGKTQQRFQFPDFTPVSAIASSKEERREFLIVGHPWEVKGVDLAIRAFRSAGPALADWTLRVVGYCPNREPYERLADGDTRILFEGPTLHVTVLDYMARCGVYLLPSRTEAYGRVAIEAMAAGKPIIGSAVGGIPTYVADGVTGVIVPSEDVNALKEAMVRLAGDAELRHRMGARARETAMSEHVETRWVAHFEAMVRAVSEGDQR